MRRARFSPLFVLLLGYLVLYPYAQNSGLPFLTFRIFGAAVTFLSIYAVGFRRRYVVVALLLAVPALIQRILLRTDAGALSLASISFGLAFDIFIVIVIFRRVFVADEPSKEAIFGALCIYLLLGFSFSNLCAMLTTVQPHAFYLDPSLNAHPIPDRFDLIYYSFATLTCLGATGITPVSAQARSVTVIESLAGVLYLAVLISRLLTAYHTHTTTVRQEQDRG